MSAATAVPMFITIQLADEASAEASAYNLVALVCGVIQGVIDARGLAGGDAV